MGPTMVVQDAISEKRIRTALPVNSVSDDSLFELGKGTSLVP